MVSGFTKCVMAIRKAKEHRRRRHRRDNQRRRPGLWGHLLPDQEVYSDNNPVPSKEVRDFAGALEKHFASKGVFITTSTFSADALEYVKGISKKIVLIDGKKLAGLMVEHDVGVSVEENYKVKKVDTDYFSYGDEL